MPNIFLWQVEPDWSDGITETLEWKTDVLQSYSGAEQRIARRLSPRRTFEFSILTDDNERQRFENRLAFAGGNTWYLPIYPDITFLDDDITSGTTTLPCDTCGRDFVIGNNVLIKSDINSQSKSILASIAVINDDSIILTEAIKTDFLTGSSIYPVRLATLTDMPELTRYNDDLLSAQIRFRVTEHNAYSNDVSNLPIYRGFPVLAIDPDWSDSLKGKYERLLLELDNNSGIAYRTDTARLPFFVQEFKWFLTERDEQVQLRQLFYYLNGCQKTIWVPSQSHDLTIKRIIAGRVLEVNHTYLAEQGAQSGRRDLIFTLIDGSTIYRRITGMAVISDLIEAMTLDLSIDCSVDQILSVSFLILCRLDSDSVSWQHNTDADGMATVSCNFRGVRDELESI